MNDGSLNVGMGYQSNGTLTIANGGVVNTTGFNSIAAEIGGFDATGTVLVTGAGSQWILSGGSMVVDNGGIGNVTIANGGNITISGEDGNNFGLALGGESATLGSMTVTDNGSVLNVTTGSTVIGSSGPGNLTIANGGTVNSTGNDGFASVYVGFFGVGNALVTGTNSTWNMSGAQLSVGPFANGMLTIANGGVVNTTVTSGNAAILGSNGGTGTVLVTDSGSQWNLAGGGLVVGNSGAGNLTIANGGVVNSLGSDGIASVYIGIGGTGMALVTGANSTWNISGGSLNVGESDIGNLTIASGGNVTGRNGIIGDQSGGSGTVLVTGANSTLNFTNGIVYVGLNSGATGELDIADGGTVSVSGTLVLGWNSGATGTVNVNSGGTLQLGGGGNGLQAGDGTANFNLAGGTLQVINQNFSATINAMLVANTTSTFDTGAFGAQWGGNFSGSGNLVKAGASILALETPNTFNGTTTIAAGALQVDNQSTLQNSTLIYVNGGGDLVISGADGDNLALGGLSGNKDIDLSNFNDDGVSLTLGGNNQDAAYSGNLTNVNNFTGSSLTKIGTGTQTLSGLNTFASNVTVNRGTLAITGGTMTVGGSVVIAGAISAGIKTLDQQGGSVTANGNTYIGVSETGTGIYQIEGGSFLQNGGSVTVGAGGIGVLMVNGGIFDSHAGQLLMGADSGIGTINLNGGVLVVSQVLSMEDGNRFNFNGGTLSVSGTTSDLFSGSFADGNVVINSGGAFIDDTGHAVTINAQLSGVGGLTKQGEGTLTLNDANTFNGTTNVVAGTLILGNVSALQNSTLNYVIGAGDINFGNPANLTLGGLSGNRDFDLSNSLGVMNLTLGGSNRNATYTGNLTDTGVLGGTLTKIGTGVQALYGNNTYTGNTTILGGEIGFNSFASFGTSNVTLAGGGVQWSASNTQDISLRINDTLGAGNDTFDTNGNDVTLASVLSGSGAFVKAGAGLLTFGADNLYTGGTVVTGGELAFTDIAQYGTNSTITLAGGGLQFGVGVTTDISADIILGAGNDTIDTNGHDVTFASDFNGGPGAFFKDGLGNLTFTNHVHILGGVGVTNGTLIVQDSGEITGPSSNYFVGLNSGDNGTLIVQNGGVAEGNAGYVGYNAGANGTILVSGEGYANFANSLIVGYAGNGTVTIVGESEVDSGFDGNGIGLQLGVLAGSSGTLIVNDPGYTNIYSEGAVVVGNAGVGNLTILNAGHVFIGNDQNNAMGFVLGNQAGSTGTVSVNGYDLSGHQSELVLVSLGALVVGNAGNGTLTIANGGDVELYDADAGNFSAYIGYAAGSTGNVTVTDYVSSQSIGSTMNLAGALVVGYNGTGNLNIANGGNVTVTGADSLGAGVYLGYAANSTGNVTVSGIESVSSTASALNISNGGLVVGQAGNGTLTISNGGNVTDSGIILTPYHFDAILGNAANSKGNVTVTGSGSVWNLTVGALLVGNMGTGNLTIANGGVVNSGGDLEGGLSVLVGGNGGTGNILVTDAGSTLNISAGALWLDVGGNGTLTVANGGNVTSASHSIIGYDADANGVATVDGANSTWTTGDLKVGEFGNGTLTVSNGGNVSVNSSDGSGIGLYLGDLAGSNGTALVTGVNSTLSVNVGGLVVGNYSAAALTIASGGNVTLAGYDLDDIAAYIGNNTGANGMVSVSGHDSILNVTEGALVLGQDGNGTLNVHYHGLVSLSGNDGFAAMYVGNQSDGSGTVQVSGHGAELETTSGAGALIVGAYGTGNLTISNHGLVDLSGLDGNDINAYIGYNNSGTVLVSGWGAELETENGALVVGDGGSGTLTVNDHGLVNLDSSDGYGVALYLGTEGGTGTLVVDGPHSKLNVDSGAVVVGEGSMGNLTISNGGTVNNLSDDGSFSAYIGVQGSSSGTVLVTGANSTWNLGLGVKVGGDGNGNLTVANGGTVNAGGILLTGGDGYGALNLNAGGTLNVGSDGISAGAGEYIFNLAGGALWFTSDGTISSANMNLVSGTNSTIATNFSATIYGYIGGDGALIKDGAGNLTLTAYNEYSGGTIIANGTLIVDDGQIYHPSSDFIFSGLSANLTIQNGGYAYANNTIVGDAPGSNNTLSVLSGAYFEPYGILTLGNQTGANGTLILSGSNSNIETEGTGFVVGNAGNGTLNILNGGDLRLYGADANQVDINIGNQTGSNGTVLVDGSDSELDSNEGAIIVGNAGNGLLTISNGGYVGAERADARGVSAYLAYAGNSTGTLLVTDSGSEFDIESGALVVGYQGMGNLTISGGNIYADGADNSNIGVYLGYAANASGTMLITNTGSSLNVNSGALVVGYNGTGSLTASNGGNINVDGADNSNIGVYLGYAANSTGTMLVTDSGSSLNVNSGALVVGYNGTGNLTIQNGAKAFTTGMDDSDVSVYLGYNAGSTGTVLVTDPNTTWAADDYSDELGALIVGYQGNGVLSIANSGFVNVDGPDLNSVSAYLGYAANATGTVNIDNASMDVSNGLLVVGYNGTGNVSIVNGGSLSIYNSGDENGAGAYLGYSANSTGSVLVSGVNGDFSSASQFEVNNGALVVGYDGAGNITIFNGGQVGANHEDGEQIGAYIGYSNISTGIVNVAGQESNSGDRSTFTVNQGALVVGFEGPGTLNISNLGLVNASGHDNSGVSAYLGYHINSQGTMSVADEGSQFELNNGALVVGYRGTGNLSISNGGYVGLHDSDIFGIGGYLGFDTGSTGTVLVTDEPDYSSELDVLSGGLVVGQHGTGNLTVANGGFVNVESEDPSNIGLYVGNLANSTGSILVTGSDSELLVGAGALVVGNAGNGNLAVKYGAEVDVSGSGNDGMAMYVGNSTTGAGSVRVSHDSSLYVDNGAMVMGNAGNGNLTISHGSEVNIDGGDGNGVSLYLGYAANSNGTVTVIGSNSQLNLNHELVIGQSGTGSLKVSHHGFVTAGEDPVLGNLTGSSGTVLVTDAGSEFDINAGPLVVGESGMGNLTIANGGQMFAFAGDNNNTSVYIGNNTNSVGTVQVMGTGSLLQINQSIFIGNSGNGTLSISNSGNVTSDVAVVGSMAGSNGNITVDGAGSVWSLNGIYLGSYGNGTLSITDGGVVNDIAGANIAQNGGFGSVSVDGANSTLSIAGDTYVGVFSVGNLTVSGGGNVNIGSGGGNLVIAYANSGNNIVTVTGSNSTLIADNSVYVGSTGNGTLTVAAGGTVSVGGILNLGAGTGTGTVNLNSGGLLQVGGGDGIQFSNQGGTYAFNFNGGTVQVINGDLTSSIDAAVNNISTIDTNSYNATWTGNLNGAGGLTKAGLGNLTLTGINSFGAQTAITNGTLIVDGATGGSLTVASAYTVIGLNSGDVANLTIQNGALLTTDNAYPGFNAGSTGNVLVTGTGTVWHTNTYINDGFLGNGTITIANGGTVSIDSNNVLTLAVGGGSNGTLNINSGGTLQVGRENGIAAGSGQYALNLAGGTIQVIVNNLTTALNATLADNTTSVIDTNTLAAEWDGVLSGNGSLAKAGLGNLTLTNANTFLGNTTISAGNLVVTNTYALQNSTLIYNNGGGNLVVDPLNTFILGGLSGNKDFDLSNSDGSLLNLTVGANGQNTTYSGNLTDMFDLGGNFTKVGAGILTLTGNNTFTGSTFINGGALNFSSFASLGAGNIYLNNATLQWAANTSTDVSNRLFLSSGNGTLDTNGNNVSFATALSGNGTLVKDGVGVLTLASTDSYAGGTTIIGGELAFTTLSEFGANSTVVLAGGGLQWEGITTDISADIFLDTGNDTIDTNGNDVTFATGLTGNGVLVKNGLGNLTINGGDTNTGGTAVSGGILLIGPSGSLTGNLYVGYVSGDNGFFDVLAASSVTVGDTFVGFGSGSNGTVLVTGVGASLSLGGNLNAGVAGTGNVTISNGGSLSDGNTTIGAGGTVTVTDPGSSLITSGIIHVNGNLTIANGGYAANATYVADAGNGNVDITGNRSELNAIGTLYVGMNGVGNVTVENGGTLIGGYGGVGVFGTGNLLVTGNGSVWDQTASQTSIGYVGNGTVTVANGGTIIFSSVDQSVALGLDSNSSGTLNINSGGTVIIGGADSLFKNAGSATINLAGGTLKIAGADFSTSIDMNLANLTVSTINTNGFSATVSSRLSGLGGFEKDGLGTLTLTNVETIGYNGTTNVTNGTLLLDHYDLDTTGDFTVAALTANSSANLVLQNSSYLTISTDVATNMTIGNTLGANDTVTVAGNSNLYVGGTTIIGNAAGANSTMQVNGGSYFETGTALIIGNQAGSNGTLSLSDPNSNMETNGAGLIVGEAGNGTLNILNGGYLDLDGVDLNGVSINIGNQTGSNGTVLVSDAQSVLETGGYDAIVGNAGNGTLTVASGGVAQLEGNTTLGLQSTGNGVINLNAGGEVDISPSGIQAGAGNYSFNLNGGTLSAQSGNWSTAINFNLGGSTPSTIDTNNYNINISGNLGGGGALDKAGAGALTLGGTNTYTGNTTVSTGALIVNGQVISNITVTGNQSVLGGNGTVGDVTLTSGGTISPGIANTVSGGLVSGFSSLTVAGNLSWASDGATANVWHLNTGNLSLTGRQSNSSDLLTVVLNILYTGSPNTPIIIDFDDTGFFDGIDPADNTYTLIESGNTLTSDGFTLAQFQAQNVGPNGQDTGFGYFQFGDDLHSLQFVVIPESATWSLWFGGVVLLLGLYRKRAKKLRAR